MRICILLALVVTLSFPINAQNTKDSTHRNAVKLNLAAFLFNNLSWQYERQLKQNWSIQIGGNIKWGGTIPKALGFGDLLVSSSTTGLRNYAFTPELRYYFNHCDCQGSGIGLYTGVYTRMTQWSSDLQFSYWNGTENIDAAGSAKLRELGIGIQLGYQFKIKKRMVVDLMFMGPRTSRHLLKLNVNSDFAEEIIPLVEEEVNEKLAYLGIDPVSIPNSANTQVKFGFSYFRYSISIGYLF